MRGVVIGVALALQVGSVSHAHGQSKGGMLFAYRPGADRSAFESGYRAHLDWHAGKQDSLTWLAWDVIAGPGMGLFVDGTFGAPFAALDARVDPAGDVRDAEVNVTPYATPVSRTLVLVREDLSRVTPGAAFRPARLAHARWIGPTPARSGELERALASMLHEDGVDDLFPYTVLELLTGEAPGFLLLVWRDSWSSWDRPQRDPWNALSRRLASGSSGPGLLTGRSEVWRFREDLTYAGGR